MDPISLFNLIQPSIWSGVAILPLFGFFSLVATQGHAKAMNTVIVYTVLAGLGLTFLILEIIFLACTPFRLFSKRFGTPLLSADQAAKLAAGHVDIEQRKIVIFDGVCVLCNGAGRFVVRHLPDPNLVSFVPFQDALSNPHVSLGKLKLEFPEIQDQHFTERIGIISGKKLLWASDAVMEVCTWMYFPFPLVALGKIIPRPIRDAIYTIVSKNRYDVFGTQPLDRNFSKSLCPYLAVKKYMEVAVSNDSSSKSE
jgi:predicted DCC family thiol-disulfide oxidoreductase YuxK